MGFPLGHCEDRAFFLEDVRLEQAEFLARPVYNLYVIDVIDHAFNKEIMVGSVKPPIE